jgi:hypothetical protein
MVPSFPFAVYALALDSSVESRRSQSGL